MIPVFNGLQRRNACSLPQREREEDTCSLPQKRGRENDAEDDAEDWGAKRGFKDSKSRVY